MTNTDPKGFKRVLKRYPKGGLFHDASIDISAISQVELLMSLGMAVNQPLVKPRELDDDAAAALGRVMNLDLDRTEFDFFVHSYSRQPGGSPSEDGPVGKLPEPGHIWTAIRPQQGEEAYVQERLKE